MTARAPGELRVGVVDTGINPWHSHVGGRVRGCRVRRGPRGEIHEAPEFFDPVGHGTAVAGVLRQALPDAELFAVRVFDEELVTYPSLVARGVLRAAAAGCAVINLSLAVAPGPGAEVLAAACAAALEAGCVLVAAGRPDRPGWLPASLPGVVGVVADDRLGPGELAVREGEPYPVRAAGCPRELRGLPAGANLWGHSFACARVAAVLATKALTPGAGSSYKMPFTAGD
ncbi:MAG: hypothetical protein Kow0092_18270 [Deferrisomatales bacterium]